MSGLFPARVFQGFGPSILEAGGTPPSVCQVQGRRPSVLRQAVRQLCPKQPGVYAMLDEHGELIYVGKAKCLRTRLASYFRPRSRDPKAGRILRRTRVIAWELAPHEFGALVRELELIRRWRPRFNVQGQPGRRRWTYVCLGRRPAPYLFLSARPPANVLACFGPVSAGRRVREAVRRVNDRLRLRDCPQAQEMVFTDQAELFPTLRAPGCLRYDIGTCLGPCAALCSRAAYGKQVRAARAFLEGTDDSLLQSLERAMKAASAALEFERAAGLRDQLASIRWLHQQLELLRRARERYSLIYPVQDTAGNFLWYLIHHGRVEGAIPAPQDAAARQAAADRLTTIYRKGTSGFKVTEAIDSVLLVAGWFRRHPEEQARTLTVAKALALCRPT